VSRALKEYCLSGTLVSRPSVVARAHLLNFGQGRLTTTDGPKSHVLNMYKVVYKLHIYRVVPSFNPFPIKRSMPNVLISPLRACGISNINQGLKQAKAHESQRLDKSFLTERHMYNYDS
jgi:hypothetical protein